MCLFSDPSISATSLRVQLAKRTVEAGFVNDLYFLEFFQIYCMVLQFRHHVYLICKALDLSLTLNIIKANRGRKRSPEVLSILKRKVAALEAKNAAKISRSDP